MAIYSAETELLFVGVVMVILFAFGVAASALFVRQWRREKNQKKK